MNTSLFGPNGQLSKGLRHFGMALFLLTFSSSVFSQKTWTGATDTDWSTASNWSPAGVPGAADDITIPNVANDPVATGIQIEIASGITMTVEAGAVLTIDGQSAAFDGIHNLGTVINNGTIDISNTTDDAIQTEGTMTNNSGGEIIINGANFGLYQHSGGVLNNDGVIKIGETASLTNQAILNSGISGGFQNNACALVHVFSDNNITDFGNNFTNDGTIILNYTGASGNSGIETNNGIIYNLGGGTFTVTTGNAPVAAIPATYTWTGATDTDWFKSCNWDSGLVPDAQSMVVIPGGTPSCNIQSLGALAKNVTVQATGLCQVLGGGKLTIDGMNTVNNCIENYGTFFIDSGGQVTVDNCTTDAIVNTGNSVFNNNGGTLFIGGISASGNIGNAGIWVNSANSAFLNSGNINVRGTGKSTAAFGRGIAVQSGNFANLGGNIFIYDTTADGIWVTSGGTFNNNEGSLDIGGIGPIGRHGIYNEANFNNRDDVYISQTAIDGIQNNGGQFSNDGGTIETFSTSLSAVANLGAAGLFENENNGRMVLSDTGAGGNGIYTNTNFENKTGGQISVENISNAGLLVDGTGSFLNGNCSSFIGDAEGLQVNPSALLTNTGYVGIDFINPNGTFNNTNGFVHDAVQTFDCAANGGTCLAAPLTHVQFISDNDNDGTSFCAGDADDLNCSTSNVHLVSNVMDDGVGSLRWAIVCASPGDTVIFSPTTDGAFIQLNSTITIDKNLVLIGNGQEETRLDGSFSDNFSLFQINVGVSCKIWDMAFFGGGGAGILLGGGILNDGDLKLVNCAFFNCQASGNGGAIFSNNAASLLSATNCVFAVNSTQNQSGAVEFNGVEATFTNCLFRENQSTNFGGAIVSFTKLNVYNCTFWGNQSTAGGAIAPGLGPNDLNIYNSIFYQNIAPNGGPDLFVGLTSMADVTDVFNNLFGDPNNSGITIGSNGNITGNPFFVDPNAGDFNLMLSSPCINTGGNAFLPADACDVDGDADTAEPIDIDLAGNGRIENGTVDMGAFEGLLTTLTFRVDMNKETVSPDGVFVAGNFMTEAEFLFDWEANIIQMSDVNGDGIYEVQLDIFAPAGTAFEYKYLNGLNGWENVPVECAVNTDGFDNRGFSTTETDFLLPVNCFNECGPCNDMCSMATDIACGQTVTGSTNGAFADPVLSCAPFDITGAGGAWYKLTGNGGVATVSTEGSEFDTQLAVFDGSCGDLECIVGNDDFVGLQSKVAFGTSLGEDYFIFVTGFALEEGNYQLNVNCGDPCPTDLVLNQTSGWLGGTFKAENSITLQGFGLTNGRSVILSAPEVILPLNVDVFFGGSLETNSVGCILIE